MFLIQFFLSCAESLQRQPVLQTQPNLASYFFPFASTCPQSGDHRFQFATEQQGIVPHSRSGSVFRQAGTSDAQCCV
ncbi:MAG: hypothetical protein CMK92_08965 [Pseudomonas sp.]|nr:hypothetical protein [Pseudomonas sp.]